MLKPVYYYIIMISVILFSPLMEGYLIISLAIMLVAHIGINLGMPFLLVLRAEKKGFNVELILVKAAYFLVWTLYLLVLFFGAALGNLGEIIPPIFLFVAIVLVLGSFFYIWWKASCSLLWLESREGDTYRQILTFIMFLYLPIFYYFIYNRINTAQASFNSNSRDIILN